MIDFFAFSFSDRLWIVLILGLTVLIQTLAVVLTHYHSKLSRLSWFENWLELSILLELLVFTLLYGQVLNGYKMGMVVPSGYEKMRILIFIMVLLFASIVAYLRKTPLPLIGLFASAITLPIVERILAHTYPWIFLLALLIFLLRSIVICIRSNQEISTHISALSVPRAIDTMHTGLLYSEEDGQIILCNDQMQDLMVLLTGSIYRNATKFYEALLSAQSNAKFDKVELEGQMVCLLPDKTAWMFTKTEILVKHKKHSHISASDVTIQWALTTDLQQKEQALKEKSNVLKKAISKLYTLCQEREIEYGKTRTHDILGQRLSVMLRAIQDKKGVNHDLLSALSKGLLEELKKEQKQTPPIQQIKNIQNIFSKIGIDIDFKGEFPKREQEWDLFIDIIRESTTNAVRHGFASKIIIQIDKKEEEFHLTITNNGYIPDKPIKLGSGIKAMREKARALGGTLEIEQDPIFTLSVMVPGGE